MQGLIISSKVFMRIAVTHKKIIENSLMINNRRQKLIRIAILDDEKPFQERISNLLKGYFLRDYNKNEYKIDCYDSGREIIDLAGKIADYTIFFLDISMDDMSGIEVAKVIRDYSAEAFIVFVTAYIDYSLEGYKVNAFRYVLKDNNNLESGLNECMNAIIQKMEYNRPIKAVKFNECDMELDVNRILYIESRLHKLEFHIIKNSLRAEETESESATANRIIILTLYQTLNNMERELSEYNTFLRVHQSYLVNMKYIKSVNRYEAVLINGEIIRIPKIRYSDVKKAFIRFMGEV